MIIFILFLLFAVALSQHIAIIGIVFLIAWGIKNRHVFLPSHTRLLVVGLYRKDYSKPWMGFVEFPLLKRNSPSQLIAKLYNADLVKVVYSEIVRCEDDQDDLLDIIEEHTDMDDTWIFDPHLVTSLKNRLLRLKTKVAGP